MAKEKADTAYAIAVAAQGEWNRMQGLKFARPTRILEERKLEDTIYVVLSDLTMRFAAMESKLRRSDSSSTLH